MSKRFSCHKISEGKAEGEALFSRDDFCFYLVDPNTGIVIEKNHCLEGRSIAGKVLIFPNGKGSSVVQADGMYQLKMKGTEPRAMIIRNPDTTLVASAIIMETPLVDRTDEEFYRTVQDGDLLEVDADGGVVTLKS
jgi:predicted aconitase with swiveling domain